MPLNHYARTVMRNDAEEREAWRNPDGSYICQDCFGLGQTADHYEGGFLGSASIPVYVTCMRCDGFGCTKHPPQF